MTALLKRLAGSLPARYQHSLRRSFFKHQIRHGSFFTDEKEYSLLGQFIGEGDLVIDVGANVGHYTLKMSELVGATGRVVSIEPVPETFALLTANARLAKHQNVTLLNLAASDSASKISMEVPKDLTGYYLAKITQGPGMSVLSINLDALRLQPVKLIKIDVEGHEMQALSGMSETLRLYKPVLILETFSEEVIGWVKAFGYSVKRLEGSSNVLAT